MASPSKPETPSTEEAPPPFLGSWRNVYIAVATYLLVLITLFYVFRRVFEQ